MSDAPQSSPAMREPDRLLWKPSRLVAVIWRENGDDQIRVFADLPRAQTWLDWTERIDSRVRMAFYVPERA